MNILFQQYSHDKGQKHRAKEQDGRCIVVCGRLKKGKGGHTALAHPCSGLGSEDRHLSVPFQHLLLSSNHHSRHYGSIHGQLGRKSDRAR